MEIRDAAKSDIDSIADLFSSDSKYIDNFFNTPKMIGERWDSFIARRVVMAGGKVVGFIGAADYYLVNREQAMARVAEAKKLFVHPAHRGKLLSSMLLLDLEQAVRGAGYDFMVGTAVSGHPYSQKAVLDGGFLPVAFAPMCLHDDVTRQGQRESALFVVKPISSDAKKALDARKTIYLPESAAGRVFLPEGFSYRRRIETIPDAKQGTNDDIDFYSARMDYNGLPIPPLEQFTLPHDSINVNKEERAGRVATGVRMNWMPLGILPFGADRLVMMYVPKLEFNPAKVRIADKAKPLADFAGRTYNQLAAARKG